MAVQGLIRLVIVSGVNGQGQLPAPVRAKGPVEGVPACQLMGKGIQRPGSDAALKIPHSVEGGLADNFAVIVSPFPMSCRGQHVPIPVQYRPGDELALGVVKVTVKGGRSPASPLGQIAEEEKDHPRRQRQSQ